MDPFEEQLQSVWLLNLDVHGYGGALCYTEDGHLVTARHVVEGIDQSLIIKGRKCDSAEWYNVKYLFDYPTLDLAILKIETSSSSSEGDGAKFPFTSLVDEIRLVPDEALVCHGHGAAIPFSSRFGKANYPYQPCNDLSTRFQNLDLTLGATDDAELASIKTSITTPLFKTVATVASVLNKKDARKVKGMHPYLPLIEQDEKCLPGFSGCPVFKVANGDLVGIFSFSHGRCGYIVPAQVTRYAIQQLSGLTI